MKKTVPEKMDEILQRGLETKLIELAHHPALDLDIKIKVFKQVLNLLERDKMRRDMGINLD